MGIGDRKEISIEDSLHRVSKLKLLEAKTAIKDCKVRDVGHNRTFNVLINFLDKAIERKGKLRKAKVKEV